MDYEKKYKEALSRARSIIEDYKNRRLNDILSYAQEDLSAIFPELEMSEDERIRKSIIELLNEVHFTFKYYDINKMLTWLEKQGQDGKVWFYRDDYVREKKQAYQDGIDNVLNSPQKYGLEKQGEQKPTIEMKTPEESLGIDSDTYNKIVDECVYGEQKPATWSEEDELRMENILSVIEGHGYPMEVKWLKSLKERYTWKPSDEQTEALDGICSYIRNKADWEISQDTIHQLYSLSEQLKKLKA